MKFKKIVLLSDFKDVKEALKQKPDLILFNEKELTDFKSKKEVEIFKTFDKEKNFLCFASRKTVHATGLWHRVVHILVFNSKGKIFLQKRPSWVDVLSDKFDPSAAGHVDLEEALEKAAIREIKEELGVDLKPILFGEIKFDFKFDKGENKEFISLFFAITDKKLKPNKEEIAFGSFYSLSEIGKKIGWKNCIPILKKEIEKFKKLKVM